MRPLVGNRLILILYGSSSPEVFLGKGVLKICRKFEGEHHVKVRFQSDKIT